MAQAANKAKRVRRGMYEISPAGARGVVLKGSGKKGKFFGFFSDNAAAVRKIREMHPRAGNPAELIIFGNPMPAALLSAFEAAAGSKAFDVLTTKPRKRLRRRNAHEWKPGSKLTCSTCGQGIAIPAKFGNFPCPSCGAVYKKVGDGIALVTRGKKNPKGKRAKVSFHFLAGWDLKARPSKQKVLRAAGVPVKYAGTDWMDLPADVRDKLMDLTGEKNPEGETEAAKDLFRKFHGKEPREVFELQQSDKRRQDFAILGPLVAIGINASKFDEIDPDPDQVVEEWEKLPHMEFIKQSDIPQLFKMLERPDQYVKNVPLLASSPNGKQLYVISESGLDLPLSAFDTDTHKDLVDLGEATFIVYVASKPRDPKEWVHTFAEEGGERPGLVWDKVTEQLLLVGGSYRVERPGIIN